MNGCFYVFNLIKAKKESKSGSGFCTDNMKVEIEWVSAIFHSCGPALCLQGFYSDQVVSRVQDPKLHSSSIRESQDLFIWCIGLSNKILFDNKFLLIE